MYITRVTKQDRASDPLCCASMPLLGLAGEAWKEDQRWCTD